MDQCVKTSLFLFFAAFLFWACEKSEVEDLQLDYGYEFFPLEIGRSWVYQADSVIFDPAPNGTRIDTVSFQIRETITDTFSNEMGGLTYRILYEERRAGQDWASKYVFSAERESTRAFREENNFRFIPLVFPVKENSRWQGNALIDPFTVVRVAGEPIEIFKGWEDYVLVRRVADLTVNGVDYEDVIEVEVVNYENLLEIRKVNAFYARNVGLIQRNMNIMNTQCTACVGQPWAEKAEEGFVLNKKLISFE